MALIVARNIWKSFGKLTVLKGLNLEINQGETVVILGRSGVGKSVLLRLIMGLERPDAGEILIDGVDIWKLSSRKREEKLKEMGMLFQGAALFDSMDVEANVGFYLSQHRDRVLNRWLNKQEKADRVSSSLEVVGLPGVQKKMPSELSGGMRKRAALARLIAYRPKILLYDEPTTGLDPITAMQINLLINQVQKDLNATSIVVTHDIRSAIEIGDRLAFHDEGIIQVVAPKDEFINLKNPQVHAFFENAVLSNHIFTGKES